jgi:hypothetical protein
VDGSQEISGNFVVASCDAPEILEPAETSLDDVAPLIGAFAEAVEGNPVGFVWNDGLGTTINDFGQLNRVRRLQKAKIEHALKLGPTNAKPLHPGLEESGLLFVQTDESPPQPEMPLYSSISLPGGTDENERRLAEMGHALLDLRFLATKSERQASAIAPSARLKIADQTDGDPFRLVRNPRDNTNDGRYLFARRIARRWLSPTATQN